MAKVRVNWGPLSEGTVKLYMVSNTAGRGLSVLAEDSKEAMSIARTANHVYSIEQKTAEPFSRMAEEINAPFGDLFTTHWTLIQTAISRRMRGTIHFEGDTMFIGKVVFRG